MARTVIPTWAIAAEEYAAEMVAQYSPKTLTSQALHNIIYTAYLRGWLDQTRRQREKVKP